MKQYNLQEKRISQIYFGVKTKDFKSRKKKAGTLFKGGNYLREEIIKYYEGLTAETIQRRKVFKGGNYLRKYGISFFISFIKICCLANVYYARLSFLLLMTTHNQTTLLSVTPGQTKQTSG
jgi:hypothetical protein